MTVIEVVEVVEGIDDEAACCPICGCELEYEDCWYCGGEGEFDEYDDDAINYAPGEVTWPCYECNGHGTLSYCPRGSEHAEMLARRATMTPQRRMSAMNWKDIEDNMDGWARGRGWGRGGGGQQQMDPKQQQWRQLVRLLNRATDDEQQQVMALAHAQSAATALGLSDLAARIQAAWSASQQLVAALHDASEAALAAQPQPQPQTGQTTTQTPASAPVQ